MIPDQIDAGALLQNLQVDVLFMPRILQCSIPTPKPFS